MFIDELNRSTMSWEPVSDVRRQTQPSVNKQRRDIIRQKDRSLEVEQQRVNLINFQRK